MNVAWKNEKLARFYSARLKLSSPNFEKIGTLYQFKCPCSETYIGETKRKLITRIKEHGEKKHNTAVYRHIISCDKFKNQFQQEYPLQKEEDLIEFIPRSFSLLQSNLSRYNTRKTVEAIEIKLKKPISNKQVFCRKINFF